MAENENKSPKYIVREVFIAKPGHAGELAKMMKEEMAKWPDFKGYVLLDAVTDYNKIVCEYELSSLADFEKMMADHKKEQAKEQDKNQDKNQDKKPPKYTELYLTGKREIYRIV